MPTIGDIMMIREAVSNTALENGWDKEKEIEVFNQTVLEIVKASVKVNRKKRHKQ
jgi:hypothetical protein